MPHLSRLTLLLTLTLAACAPAAPAATATSTVVPATSTLLPPTATASIEVTATTSTAPEGAQLSEQGLFRVWYTSAVEPPPVNEFHEWTLHVETAAGEPVEDAIITVAGDMPAHGHGLPTQPEVTDYLGHGDYRVEGMKFSMGGDWVMTFHIEAGGMVDDVDFDLTLDEP